ncbi:MAG: tRNA pseudouridine(13) synthase TruD, partial [Xanthomonadaceae bacterium]|nr:tRNA pseudouridine(13) synthase TruD [Xanthomonadaceae bacterium]
ARVQAHDVHPAAPLWGKGELRCDGAARALVLQALQGSEALRQGLEDAGLNQEFRALRLLAKALRWEWLQPDTLQLAFELPAGAYATTVLHALGDCD